jgi:hypothetical protein
VVEFEVIIPEVGLCVVVVLVVIDVEVAPAVCVGVIVVIAVFAVLVAMVATWLVGLAVVAFVVEDSAIGGVVEVVEGVLDEDVGPMQID